MLLRLPTNYAFYLFISCRFLKLDFVNIAIFFVSCFFSFVLSVFFFLLLSILIEQSDWVLSMAFVGRRANKIKQTNADEKWPRSVKLSRRSAASASLVSFKLMTNLFTVDLKKKNKIKRVDDANVAVNSLIFNRKVLPTEKNKNTKV